MKWGWAFLSLITFNGCYLGFPLWNRTIVGGYYRQQGWRVYESELDFTAKRNDAEKRAVRRIEGGERDGKDNNQ